MPFSQSDINELHQYITDNGLGKHITVLSDSVEIRIPECNGRFRAVIKSINSDTLSLHVYDSEPQSRELGFTYGLPSNCAFLISSEEWNIRELLAYVRSLLYDLLKTQESLHECIRSLRVLACDCFELNRAYDQLGIDDINFQSELERIIPTILPPELRKNSVPQTKFSPDGNPLSTHVCF